jgi:hypothetical protein
VVKKTNFLQDLYSDEELTPAYLREGRDNKTLFMKKLVTAVCKSKDHRILQKNIYLFIQILPLKDHLMYVFQKF